MLRLLHEALIDIIGFTNRPQNDLILLREAGVSLDRALFPLLVVIQRRGPVAVGQLADWIGRDYTTVSRQVAKLEALGLVARRAGETDARVTEAVVTNHGARPLRTCWTRRAVTGSRARRLSDGANRIWRNSLA